MSDINEVAVDTPDAPDTGMQGQAAIVVTISTTPLVTFTATAGVLNSITVGGGIS